jgi:hypothetical protein
VQQEEEATPETGGQKVREEEDKEREESRGLVQSADEDLADRGVVEVAAQLTSEILEAAQRADDTPYPAAEPVEAHPTQAPSDQDYVPHITN